MYKNENDIIIIIITILVVHMCSISWVQLTLLNIESLENIWEDKWSK